MQTLRKMWYCIKFGGVKFLIIRVIDKVFKTHATNEYIYDKSSKADPGEYEYLLSLIYGMRKGGGKLNLQNPTSFNEKIQWLKLYDTTTLKTQLADKWRVKEWVAKKIGEEYLIPLLGVWDKFDDIDLDKLPDSFVLKANHGSGMNVVVLDKLNHDWKSTKQKFDLWLAQNFAYVAGFELQYKDIQPKIIAEQYIETKAGDLYDYKIHCFNGIPTYIQIMGERNLETHQVRHAFYNTEWIPQPFTYTNNAQWETIKEKPDKLDEMIEIANILCEGFSYVRVDLYQLDNNDLKFGEMTFSPASGFMQWTPLGTNIFLGEKIILPERKL